MPEIVTPTKVSDPIERLFSHWDRCTKCNSGHYCGTAKLLAEAIRGEND